MKIYFNYPTLMQQKHCEAIYEKGVLRPLTNLQLSEGESVKIIIESPSKPNKKQFPEDGIIAQLTEKPIKIEHFNPLTRQEANERW